MWLSIFLYYIVSLKTWEERTQLEWRGGEGDDSAWVCFLWNILIGSTDRGNGRKCL